MRFCINFSSLPFCSSSKTFIYFSLISFQFITSFLIAFIDIHICVHTHIFVNIAILICIYIYYLYIYMLSWVKDDAIWIPKFANYFSIICGIKLIWSHHGKMFQMHYNEIMNMHAVLGIRICSSCVLRGLFSGRTSVKHVWSPCFWQLYHMCTYIP